MCINHPNSLVLWNVLIVLLEYNILTPSIIVFHLVCLYFTLWHHFRGLQWWCINVSGACSVTEVRPTLLSPNCEVSPLPSVLLFWPLLAHGVRRPLTDHHSHNALAQFKTRSRPTVRFGIGFTPWAEMDKPVGSSVPASAKPLNSPRPPLLQPSQSCWSSLTHRALPCPRDFVELAHALGLGPSSAISSKRSCPHV